MHVVGLTGGIGMGKSTVSSIAIEMGIPVWDADAEVHAHYAHNDHLRDWLRVNYPSCWVGNDFDRKQLRTILFGDATEMAKLTREVNYYVEVSAATFIAAQRYQGSPLVILDVPLLFEMGFDRMCSTTVTVSCTAETQRKRVLARPGMTPALLDDFLRRQYSDSERRQRSRYIVDTELPIEATREWVVSILEAI